MLSAHLRADAASRGSVETTVCRIFSCRAVLPHVRAAFSFFDIGRSPRSPTKYAGGHRIRVTPVPIPNTEVKPDTADGTARETVWESRSLPAVIRTTRTPEDMNTLGRFCLYAGPITWPAPSRRQRPPCAPRPQDPFDSR